MSGLVITSADGKKYDFKNLKELSNQVLLSAASEVLHPYTDVKVGEEHELAIDVKETKFQFTFSACHLIALRLLFFFSRCRSFKGSSFRTRFFQPGDDLRNRPMNSSFSSSVRGDRSLSIDEDKSVDSRL